MKIEKTNREYLLGYSAVDEISDVVQDFLKKLNMESRNILRIRLSLEQILLDMREHFGDGTPCRLQMGSQWKRPYITLEIKRERYNPLEEGQEQDEFGDWSKNLLANMGLTPVHIYQKGKNLIVLKMKKARVNPLVQLFLAIVSGLAFGILGQFLPDGIRSTAVDSVLTPVFEVFLGILSTIAGPMIFLSVA